MAELPFAFIINGQELDPTATEDPEQAELLEQIVDSISAKMAGLTCPSHHQPPRFLCRGTSLQDLNIQVYGCCEQLIDLTNHRMSSGQA